MRVYYFPAGKRGLSVAAFVFWCFYPVVLRQTAQQVAVLLGQRIILSMRWAPKKDCPLV